MPTALSMIWTPVANSISYEDNHTNGTSSYFVAKIYQLEIIRNNRCKFYTNIFCIVQGIHMLVGCLGLMA